MSRGKSLGHSIETNILNYLFVAAESFRKCLKALSFQQESVLCENTDNLIIQAKNSSIIADNAVCYKKTADALLLDIKRENIPVDPLFFSKVAQFEKDIEKLDSDYNKSYIILKNKIKDLMDKYDKKIVEFSKISKIVKKENNASFYHLSEMLDVSV